MVEIAEIENELLRYVRTSVLESGVSIDRDTPFKQLGVDSLSIIAVVLFVERKFGIRIPEDDLIPDNLGSINAVAACCYRLLSAESP
jgi:acyl carrier protein